MARSSPRHPRRRRLRINNRQGTIVRNVNLVDVLFSVVTKREKLVTDLNKENFKVFDDGVQQEITSFSQPTDLPLRIGMVLDTSNSIRDRLKFEQDAAIDFIFNALRRGKDQAFLMTFDDGPQDHQRSSPAIPEICATPF